MLSHLLRTLKIPFVQDFAVLSVGQLISLGLGLLSSVILARLLGIQGYGTYAIILTFAGLVAMFSNFGQSPTTLTFLAEAYGRKDTSAMRSVLFFHLTMALFSVLLLACAAIVAPILTHWLYGDPSIGRLAAIVFYASMGDQPYTLLTILLQVFRKIRLLTFLENMRTVTQVTLLASFLFLGWGVLGALLSTLGTALLFCLLSLVLFPLVFRGTLLPSLRSVFQLRRTYAFWRLVRETFWMAVDKNLGNLYPNIFILLLSIRAPREVVGLIRLALKLAELPALAVTSAVGRLASSVIPTFISREAPIVRALLWRLVRSTFLLHFVVTICAMLLVPLFIPMVYGASFRSAMYPFWVVVALNLSLALHSMATPILRVYRRIWISAIYNAIAALLGVILFSILLYVQIRPTWALYCSLALYHCVIAGTIVAAAKLVFGRSPPLTDHTERPHFP